MPAASVLGSLCLRLRLLREALITAPCAVVLDLFSGASAPVTRRGVLCFQPIDLLRGSGVDANKLRLRKLCASGIVGLAPPCAAYSQARLKPKTPDLFVPLSTLTELGVAKKMHLGARALRAFTLQCRASALQTALSSLG